METHDSRGAHDARKDDEINVSPRAVQYALIIVISLVMAYSQSMIGGLQANAGAMSAGMAQMGILLASRSAASAPSLTQNAAPAGGSQVASQPITAGTGVDLNALAAQLIPTGVPAVYGAELGVSFDDPVNSMQKMGKMDDGKGMADAAENARYVKIGSEIACEYCCGAQTLVFPNGQAACGCAHSFAMRGLLKYLVQKHPEMTDGQMLEEVAKWKMMFFPKDMVTKAGALSEGGIELTYANIGSNEYRGRKLSSAPAAPAGASADSLPSQVGGC